MIQTKKLLFLFFSLLTFCANAQWVAQQNPNKTNLTGVDFLDNKTGIVCGIFNPANQFGGVASTINGGNTWITSPFSDIGKIKFTTKGKVFGILEPLYMAYSKENMLEFEYTFIMNSPNDFSVPDTFNLHVVGALGRYAKVFPNESYRIEVRNNLNTSQDMYGVHFPDTATGYTCGDAGTIRKTTTGGKSWTAQSSGSSSSLRSVFLSVKT